MRQIKTQQGNRPGAKKGKPHAYLDIEHIEKLASRGLTMEQIASALNIDRNTLYHHRINNPEIEQAIKRGKAKGIASVANVLFEQALQREPWAVCFYLKTAGGWREKPEQTEDRTITIVREITSVPNST